jgi:undecaprenyl diphosphate synthase
MSVALDNPVACLEASQPNATPAPTAVPRHIAIIMDGNGRWAKQRGLPRLEGHRRGYRTVRDIVRVAGDMGVKVLTLYVFSVENWKRPKREIDGLMHLIEFASRNELRDLHASNVRMRFSGRREGLPESLKREMDRADELTRGNTGLTLNLALNYGGRAEILDSVKALAVRVLRGELNPTEITEQDIACGLYAPDLPDPDLLIRTAGEMRVSNFLLWGIAYAELWVTDVYWPDFSHEHLAAAIADFQRRDRKFGTVTPE